MGTCPKVLLVQWYSAIALVIVFLSPPPPHLRTLCSGGNSQVNAHLPNKNKTKKTRSTNLICRKPYSLAEQNGSAARLFFLGKDGDGAGMG